MTAHPEINGGSDLDQLHRDEITVAINWVIRTCQGVVRDHSHKTFWVLTGTATGAAPAMEDLIESARTDVLGKLRRQIDGADAIIIGNAEHERTKPGGELHAPHAFKAPHHRGGGTTATHQWRRAPSKKATSIEAIAPQIQQITVASAGAKAVVSAPSPIVPSTTLALRFVARAARSGPGSASRSAR